MLTHPKSTVRAFSNNFRLYRTRLGNE